MFNKKRIEALEGQIKDLHASVHYYRSLVEELQEDLRTLAQHSGVEFEEDKSRKLVKLLP